MSCGRRFARSAQEVDRLTQLAEDLLLIARSDRGRVPSGSRRSILPSCSLRS